MNLCDMKSIKQIMAMFSLNFKKEFGQNFLTDNLVVEDIADMCCDFTAKTILEIGPGIGPLTQELAKAESEIARAVGKLNNQGFVAKAPAKLVEEEKAKVEKYTTIV